MRKVIIVTIVLVCTLFMGSICSFAEIVKQQDVKIPMRDGVELSANIVLPDSEGKFPVIIVRTPYGKEDPDDEDEDNYWATRGYGHVFQDCRGTGQSGGKWKPGAYDRKDGFDTHKWVLEQPWCNGVIGTSGGSYLGYTQVVTAPDAGDYLKAMFTVVPLMGWYEHSGYVGGAMRLQLMMGWGSEMLKPNEGENAGLPEDWDVEKAYWHLPLSRWDETIGYEVDFMREWVAHYTYDNYWQEQGNARRVEEVRAANITVTGWYDIFIKQAFDYVSAVRQRGGSDKARKHCHLVVGPWGHGPNAVVGEREFSEDSEIDAGELEEKWFARWLKGEDTGVDDWPAYRIFVMGKNEWRNEDEWPLARTKYTKYYFHSEGSANTMSGDGSLSTKKCGQEPSDKFIYDPENPVPTKGGCLLMAEGGAFDQREIEKRDDVLVYTSDVLEENLEVTGPVKVVLYASSDAKDTDWTGKLLDVYPDGTAYNLCDGIIRARFRDSILGDKLSLIEPGKIYRYEIDLWVTSNVFVAGHKIRVEISSSNFPIYDRNPNTGHEFGVDAELRKAKQEVYHNEEYPSHIVLPVIED
ncbi:MAG: CocE/NonD family hydrolase [Planctomycetota bacterium]|jgi:putative CocE/NonD family hydrolase